MAITFVKNVASNSASNATSVSATVPASGCAAGNMIVVRLYNFSNQALSTLVDTPGNSYSVWVTMTVGTDNIYLYKSRITNALSSGNTITATWGSMANCTIAVDEFSGVADTEDGENTATGSSTTPSAAVTPAELGLVYGHLGVAGTPSYTEDADTDNGDSWHSLSGVITSSRESKGAYKITTGSGTNTYNPTLGAITDWMEQVGTLKATAVTKAFPPLNRRKDRLRLIHR